MKLFKRNRRLVGFEVIFEPGGAVYTYLMPEAEFRRLMLGRYRVRGDLPHVVRAVYGDGSRARVELRVTPLTKSA